MMYGDKKRVKVSLSDSDYEFLLKFCEKTIDKPATVLRRLFCKAKDKELVTKLGTSFFGN